MIEIDNEYLAMAFSGDIGEDEADRLRLLLSSRLDEQLPDTERYITPTELFRLGITIDRDGLNSSYVILETEDQVLWLAEQLAKTSHSVIIRLYRMAANTARWLPYGE